MDKMKCSLSFRFKMEDLGILSWFVGIKFDFYNAGIIVNQISNIEKIITKFDMNQCKPKNIPF